MKNEIRFESKAEIDVLEAAHYYEQQRANLGTELLDKSKETIGIIQNHPMGIKIAFGSFEINLDA